MEAKSLLPVLTHVHPPVLCLIIYAQTHPHHHHHRLLAVVEPNDDRIGRFLRKCDWRTKFLFRLYDVHTRVGYTLLRFLVLYPYLPFLYLLNVNSCIIIIHFYLFCTYSYVYHFIDFPFYF